jgi:hypothetical protein
MLVQASSHRSFFLKSAPMGRPLSPSLGSSCSPGSDPPDLVPKVLGEPEVAIWTFRDGLNVASYSRSKLGDLPLGRDPSDLAHIGLDEPEVAARARRDTLGTAVECWDRKLGNRPTGRDAPDLVPVVLGEPAPTLLATPPIRRRRRSKSSRKTRSSTPTWLGTRLKVQMRILGQGPLNRLSLLRRIQLPPKGLRSTTLERLTR